MDVLVDQIYQPGAHQIEWEAQNKYGASIKEGFYFLVMHIQSENINTTLSQKILKR